MEEKKKNKDKKRKTGEAEVLVTGKGKAPPRGKVNLKTFPSIVLFTVLPNIVL